MRPCVDQIVEMAQFIQSVCAIKEGDQVIIRSNKLIKVFQIRKSRYGMSNIYIYIYSYMSDNTRFLYSVARKITIIIIIINTKFIVRL